jgi:hypothetical protein
MAAYTFLGRRLKPGPSVGLRQTAAQAAIREMYGTPVGKRHGDNFCLQITANSFDACDGLFAVAMYLDQLVANLNRGKLKVYLPVVKAIR